jgi:hypothetical protein
MYNHLQFTNLDKFKMCLHGVIFLELRLRHRGLSTAGSRQEALLCQTYFPTCPLGCKIISGLFYYCRTAESGIGGVLGRLGLLQYSLHTAPGLEGRDL